MSRRTSTIAVVVAALCVLSGSSFARSTGHGSPGAQTQRYARPDGFRTYHWDQPYDYFTEPAQISFDPPAGAAYVHLTVVDDAGDDVMVRVTQTLADGGRGTDLYYCLKDWTGKLVSSNPVEVRVYSGACTDHTIAVVTEGSVTATFPAHAHIAHLSEHHHHGPAPSRVRVP